MHPISNVHLLADVSTMAELFHKEDIEVVKTKYLR